MTMRGLTLIRACVREADRSPPNVERGTTVFQDLFVPSSPSSEARHQRVRQCVTVTYPEWNVQHVRNPHTTDGKAILG